MARNKIPVRPMVAMSVMTFFSCSKESVGYCEVRSQPNDTFTNVTRGDLILLGTIAVGEKKGDETESFTGKYLHLEIGDGTYRSHNEIFVDPYSSATFKVYDKNQLEKLK